VTITRTQYLLIQTLFSVLLNTLISSALADTRNASFSIYCISNGDGTGNCTRDDNKKPISCIGMPGVTVECQDRKQNKYECVPFGFIDTGQAQVQLSCENKSSDNFNDGLFDVEIYVNIAKNGYNSIGSFFSLLELYSIQFPLLKGNLSNKQSGGKKIFKYYKTTPKNNRNTRKIQGKQAISNKNNKNL